MSPMQFWKHRHQLDCTDLLSEKKKNLKGDGFMKALKRLRGTIRITYAEVGHNAMVARFVTVEVRDRILRMGPWLFED